VLPPTSCACARHTTTHSLYTAFDQLKLIAHNSRLAHFVLNLLIFTSLYVHSWLTAFTSFTLLIRCAPALLYCVRIYLMKQVHPRRRGLLYIASVKTALDLQVNTLSSEYRPKAAYSCKCHCATIVGIYSCTQFAELLAPVPGGEKRGGTTRSVP
jgi:hypothetical protein